MPIFVTRVMTKTRHLLDFFIKVTLIDIQRCRLIVQSCSKSGALCENTEFVETKGRISGPAGCLIPRKICKLVVLIVSSQALSLMCLNL